MQDAGSALLHPLCQQQNHGAAKIIKKLKKSKAPLSIASIQERLNDIAGVRVICEYICDIYRVREVLLATEQIKCEIQLRTTAIDCWAGLEHNLRYKKDRTLDEEINEDLLHCVVMLFETDGQMQDIAERMGMFS